MAVRPYENINKSPPVATGIVFGHFDLSVPFLYNFPHEEEPSPQQTGKLSNLLFDLVKYLLTVIGAGAIIPGGNISFITALMGILIAFVVLSFALVMTPEEKE